MKKKARSPPLRSFDELRDIDLDDDVRDMLDVAEGCFQNTECWIIRVPARLCLAADHTDYWDGLLPSELITFASDSCTMKAIVSPRNDEQVIRIFNMDDEYEDQWLHMWKIGRFSSALANEKNRSREDGTDWSEYVKGVISQFGTNEEWRENKNSWDESSKKYREFKDMKGFDMLIGSSIPGASGASSSSALTICAAIAVRLTNNWMRMNMWPSRVAAETALAEWFVGTRGGAMDHVTMVFSQEERFLLYRMKRGSSSKQIGELLEGWVHPVEGFQTRHLGMPIELNDWRFVTIFTHAADKGNYAVKRAFNTRASAARYFPYRIMEAIEEGRPMSDVRTLYKDDEHWDLEWLRNILSMMTKEIVEDVVQFMHDSGGYPLNSNIPTGEQIQNWFEFAVNEFERSRRVQKLLEESMDVNELGEIMDEAWQEAGDLYGIRTEKMDAIAEVCRSCDGVLGMKVMGAGFGGNLLALVRKDSIDDLRAICEGNSELFERSIEDSLFVHKPGPGVSICTGPTDDFGWRLLWPSVEE